MYSDEDISSAIAAGILTEQTAAAFREHVASLKSVSAVDEEHFRLITGFNDIFVVIACLLLLASVGGIGAAMSKWLGAAAVSGTAWALGEFFIRKRRMALPAIVLLLAFVGGVLAAGLLAVATTTETFVVASAIAAVAAWLHWLRFHVPITVASGAAAVIGCVVALLLTAVPEARGWTTPISLISGIAVFTLAMTWDAADPQRLTRKSDVAFWLHLLAAPLLVHPVFSILGVFGGQTDMDQAIAVVALYIAIAFISLAVDRRALMVSALIYVLYTFSTLLKQFGVVSLSFAITALVIGSALLLLSAFWHPSRAFVLRLFPHTVQKHLAPFR
jgi:hypothetical protein